MRNEKYLIGFGFILNENNCQYIAHPGFGRVHAGYLLKYMDINLI
jgi:hypothetical protein